MKRKNIVPWILVIGMIVLIAGCTKDGNPSTPGTLTETQVLQQMVVTMDSVAEFSSSDEATIDDNGMQDPNFDATVKVSADVSPVRWGRHIFWDQIVRTYDVVKLGDSVAIVTVKKTIPGEFWVGIRLTDTVRVDSVIKKPFVEKVERKVRFRRVANFAEYERNWLPVALTMVVGKTDSVNNFSITSFEVSGRVDTTITSPLDTWFRLVRPRGGIPVFIAGDSVIVSVTVQSSDDSNEIVSLRHGIRGGSLERRRSIMPLVSTTGSPGNYTRVYQRKFRAGLPLGIIAARFNAAVDVVSRGSLFDDAAPFSNEFWGMPYIIVR